MSNGPTATSPPAPPLPEQGPLASDLLLVKLDELARLQAELIAAFGSSTRGTVKRNVSSGQLDGTGNAAIKLFDVPAGMWWRFNRLVIEAAGFTPAAPYSNAACWFGIYALSGGSTATGIGTATDTVGRGALLDFGPIPSGTQALPALGTFERDSAPYVQENMSAWLVVRGGPASASIWCQWQVTEFTGRMVSG